MKRKKYFAFGGLLSLAAAIFLAGCSTIVILDPKGPVGDSARFVIIAASVLMAIVVIPVFIMNFWFARQYRAANTKATYRPQWHYSLIIDITMWAVPIAIVTVLAILAWTRTHALDPYKPIASAEKPVNIEAVALDWKWLFIYPDEKIATVNQIAFPVKVPISFKITSNTVMASFFIPQLGSQIYAMAGMQTRLHLMADKPGTYAGHNQQFTGESYADMHFKADAVSPEEFQAWVQRIKQSPEKLDQNRFERLAEPVPGYHPVTYFSSVQPDLFEFILHKFHSTKSGLMHQGSFLPSTGTGISEEK